MKKTNLTLLLHPFFIACLFTLLLNDFVLKTQLHNWFTGKLSDVAGLAVFALFFTALFSQKKQWVYGVITVLFIVFKSPLSQPLINILNYNLHIPLNRVVDYTDDAALLVLFLTWQLKPVPVFNIYRKMAVYTVGLLSVFSFCATSMPQRYLMHREDYYISDVKDYRVHTSEEGLYKKLDSLHLSYRIDSIITEKIFLRSNGDIYFNVKDSLADTMKVVHVPKNLTPDYTNYYYNTGLYHRFAVKPFIAITNYVIEGDTLPAIRIAYDEFTVGNRTKHYVTLKGIQFSKELYDKHHQDMYEVETRYVKIIKRDILKKLQ